MDTIRRLPASAGAEWLLGGFALLRQAPLALGMLGALWGVLGALVIAFALAVPALAAALQLLLALAGPLLFAGLVWAVRELTQGRPPQPGHLLHGLREAWCRRCWRPCCRSWPPASCWACCCWS